MSQVPGLEYRTAAPLSPINPGIQKRIDTEHYVEGYAAKFGVPYVLFEYDGKKYYEVIDRGALDGADVSDVIFQYDHTGKILARQSNGTLGVEADDTGIFIYADLSKSPEARNTYEEISNGLVTKMSWAFTLKEHKFDRETKTYTIMKIRKMYDVSAVTYPANPDTEISARSLIKSLEEAEKRQFQNSIAYLKLKLKLGGIS